MSLSSALSSAVSGLTAQSAALSAISENIANSSTTAYKTKDTSFAALLSGNIGSTNTTSGVVARSSQNMLAQGLISSTGTSTNLAIDGNGFFVVADSTTASASNYAYTRDGSFTTDSSGNMVNGEGYYLMGYATDADGNVSGASGLSGLQPINVSSINGTAQATENITMSANLPADAAVGATFTSSVEAIDSVGVSNTIGQTWTKTGANTWTLDLAAPYATNNPGTASGTVSPSSFTVTFDGNGVLASISPSTTITLSGMTSGAADSTVNLNLGTAGDTSGMTQYASSSGTPGIEITSVTQDGARYGALSSISIDGEGLVTAHFDNGITRSIYKIPLATFSNPNGLTQISGTTYSISAQAGTLHLQDANSSGSGIIQSSSLEGSTTDTATEFNKMIVAQQAYSAAAQIVTAVDNMFTSLIQAVR